MVVRTLLLRAAGAARAHVPMIKFRKGGLSHNDEPISIPLSGSRVKYAQIRFVTRRSRPPIFADPRSMAKTGGSGPVAQSSHPVPSACAGRPTIEDYQLPPKYRRTPLSDTEIAYINRGGPE